MPYRWSGPAPDGSHTLRLWPHRALSPRGFAVFIAITALLFALPLLALLGGPALWFVLAPVLAALWAIWTAIRRNSRMAERGEVLTLSRARLTLTHTLTDPPLTWQANPYWVRVTVHRSGGPVADYLTLTGEGRAVELGAFLTPEERRTLAGDLDERLGILRSSPGE